MKRLLNSYLPFYSESIRRKRIFEYRIRHAQKILDINPIGLNTLIRALGRAVQAESIQNILNFNDDNKIPTQDFENLFFDPLTPISVSGKNAMDLMLLSDRKFKISLSRDLVIPWPWNQCRASSAFATIGYGKAQGDWQADFNHKIQVLLPIGVGIVHGGNHSISAGIVNGEGFIINSMALDISPLYSEVKFDGDVYRRKYDNEVIGATKKANMDFGAIFEIGRLMFENEVGFDGQPWSNELTQSSSGDEKFAIRYAVYKDNIKQLFDVTESAVAFHLNRQGISEGSDTWRAIFRGESSITLERFGLNEEYKFIRYIPPPLYNKLF